MPTRVIVTAAPIRARRLVMTSSSTVAPPLPIRRADTGTLLGSTMSLVAATSGVFALAAYVGRDGPGWSTWFWFAAAFAVLLGMNSMAERSDGLAVGLLFTFGALIGLATAPAISSYANADPQAVWQAGGATALFVAGIGTIGYSTRRDLSGLARTSLWALVGLVAFGVVAIFVEIPNGSLIYSVLGLVVFAGLTMLDFQRLRRSEDVASAPQFAAEIFLDVLNVFLFFLPIFGGDQE
jgi:FtsH-binding integral membrane protein